MSHLLCKKLNFKKLKCVTLNILKMHVSHLLLFFVALLQIVSPTSVISNIRLKQAASRRHDSPQVLRVRRGAVQDALLPPQPPKLQLQKVDVLHALVVVEVSFAED